jgi:hypothetical protein
MGACGEPEGTRRGRRLDQELVKAVRPQSAPRRVDLGLSPVGVTHPVGAVLIEDVVTIFTDTYALRFPWRTWRLDGSIPPVFVLR